MSPLRDRTVLYNSCRDRHCPTCQGAARERWLRKRMRELLPVPYFHVVFTLPHRLNPLIRYNRKALIDLFFKEVTFRYRDRADGDVEKTKTLPAATFIHRFLLHILPKGMQKIRFCGWMGRNVRRENLRAIRQSIGVPPPEREPPAPPTASTCPCCAKAALVLVDVHQPRAPPPVCRGRTGREAA